MSSAVCRRVARATTVEAILRGALLDPVADLTLTKRVGAQLVKEMRLRQTGRQAYVGSGARFPRWQCAVVAPGLDYLKKSSSRW
jgi:hypothetical protein